LLAVLSAITMSLPVIAADDSKPRGQRQLQAIAINFAYTAAGGSYSATTECNTVGPEGGQLVVGRAVEAINGLWRQNGVGNA
jgi:hypothetical protein